MRALRLHASPAHLLMRLTRTQGMPDKESSQVAQIRDWQHCQRHRDVRKAKASHRES